MFDDLRQYVDWLKAKNLITVVKKKVSSELEITEVVTRLIENQGPVFCLRMLMAIKSL